MAGFSWGGRSIYLAGMKVKIHCFEGEWNDKHPELSVKPLLQVLEQSCLSDGRNFEYSYRSCQTIDRLRNRLGALDKRSINARSQHCFYFAFHGTSKGLWSLENEPYLTFEQLAVELDGNAAGSVVFFGSCGTIASEKKLRAFKEKSGAALVVGYASAVDWLLSSVFELFFLGEFCQIKGDKTFKKLRTRLEQATAQAPFAKLKAQII